MAWSPVNFRVHGPTSRSPGVGVSRGTGPIATAPNFEQHARDREDHRPQDEARRTEHDHPADDRYESDDGVHLQSLPDQHRIEKIVDAADHDGAPEREDQSLPDTTVECSSTSQSPCPRAYATFDSSRPLRSSPLARRLPHYARRTACSRTPSSTYARHDPLSIFMQPGLARRRR